MARPRKHDGSFFERMSRSSGGWTIATARANAGENQRIPTTGKKLRDDYGKGYTPDSNTLPSLRKGEQITIAQ
jgi:hypothetical protein